MGTAMCFTKKESKGGTKPESITDVEKLNRFLVYEKIETLYEFLPVRLVYGLIIAINPQNMVMIDLKIGLSDTPNEFT